MTTDVFLGGLASLILAAVVIVALTTNKGNEISRNSNGGEDTRNSKRGE